MQDLAQQTSTVGEAGFDYNGDVYMSETSGEAHHAGTQPLVDNGYDEVVDGLFKRVFREAVSNRNEQLPDHDQSLGPYANDLVSHGAMQLPSWPDVSNVWDLMSTVWLPKEAMALPRWQTLSNVWNLMSAI